MLQATIHTYKHLYTLTLAEEKVYPFYFMIYIHTDKHRKTQTKNGKSSVLTGRFLYGFQISLFLLFLFVIMTYPKSQKQNEHKS